MHIVPSHHNTVVHVHIDVQYYGASGICNEKQANTVLMEKKKRSLRQRLKNMHIIHYWKQKRQKSVNLAFAADLHCLLIAGIYTQQMQRATGGRPSAHWCDVTKGAESK